VFDGLMITFRGKFTQPQRALHELVMKNGGQIGSTVCPLVHYLCASDDDDQRGKAFKDAESKGVPVVRENWLAEAVAKGVLPVDTKFYYSQPNGGSATKGGVGWQFKKNPTGKIPEGLTEKEIERAMSGEACSALYRAKRGMKRAATATADPDDAPSAKRGKAAEAEVASEEISIQQPKKAKAKKGKAKKGRAKAS